MVMAHFFGMMAVNNAAIILMIKNMDGVYLHGQIIENRLENGMKESNMELVHTFLPLEKQKLESGMVKKLNGYLLQSKLNDFYVLKFFVCTKLLIKSCKL
jgi:hypothetical protein